jgi:surface protein
MFDTATAFNQDISTWNTAAVITMRAMFIDATSFNQNINTWNTGNVINMEGMFSGATSFNQPLNTWNTANVTNMGFMFVNATAFNQSLAAWNMGAVTNAGGMLNNSGLSIANYDATLIGWAGQTLQTGVALGAVGLQYCAGAAARTTLTGAPNNWVITGDALSCAALPFITTWITGDGEITIPTTGGGYNYNVTWTNLTNAGVGDGSITGQTGNYTITGLENGSTYRVEISGNFPHFYMNNDATNAPKLRTIEQWGDIAWTSMANAFHGSANLTYNATDVPNLAGVTDMSFMFTNCSSFNGNASMNTWNTTSITNMSYLFAGASVFNQDISGWDVSNVTNMSGMFILASAFNQDISGWTTNNVISMYAMFQDAIAFNQNIGGWTTTAVTNMSYLFAGATVFNQDISGWNTAAVTDMSYMFNAATAFNQNIGGWTTAAVTTMSNIFNSATTFNQNLATWNISTVTDMTDMLSNSGLSLANYDATLIGWAGQTVQAGVNLGATGLQYCAGAAARTTLTGVPNNWTITGDTQVCAGYFSRKTGNWSDVTAGDGTWSTIAVGGASCDCTPVAGADVVIDAAHIVTADVNTNTNSIALGGTLDLQDLTHTFTDITNNGGAGILRIGGGTAAGTIAGTTGTFFTTATNTVVFDGTVLYALPNRNYPTLEITGTGVRTLGGGTVDILGNLNATGGTASFASTATINFPNVGILPHLIQGTAGDQISLTDVTVNGDTEVNAGFGFNFNGVVTVNAGFTFTNNNAFLQANSPTSDIAGAGTFVNRSVVYWLSDVTPSIANFDANTNANTFVYQTGTAPPRNAIYDVLFFRDTRSTVAGAITANQITFDNFASPAALNLDNTNITVNNNLELANPNGGTLNFGTGNATVIVNGNLIAATAGSTITHNAGVGNTQVLDLVGATNALDAFTNTSVGTSIVRYSGVNQQVFASPNYQNLEILGGGVKNLLGAVTASGTLTLTNGRLQLGANDLTLSNAIVANQLTGAPYTTSWVETDGAGSLIRQGAGAGIDFPVGDATAVRLVNFSNTDAGNNIVRFNPTIAPIITGANPAAGMWTVNTNVTTDLTFSNVGGTADATSEIHYDNAGWTALTTTGGTPPYIATGFVFTGVEVNFTIFSPSVVIDVSMADLTAVNINEDIFKANRQRIYAMEISATGGAPTLTDLVTTTTLGTYTAADIANFELYYNTVDNFTTATLIATSGASTGSGENISFTGFSQIIAGGGVPQYLYIAANVNAGATTGNTMSIPFLAVGNFTFIETVNPTASLGPSGTKTISDATLPFITTWITTDGTIIIPTNGGGYNYDVTWTNLTNAGVGDGFITGQTGNYTITGLENGSTYRVEISKDFPHFFMNNNATEAPKLRTIEQWGNIAWASMANAFHGSANLTYNATDVPNLAGVTDMSFMFTNCSSFNGNASMNTWNTTSITNMSYLFAGASVFNQDISGWDVSNVTNMSGMFILASAFNQDIGGWTTNNVISMLAMFQDAIAFNQNIGVWTTTAVTNMSYLFAGATVFNQDISGWNTAAVTTMSNIFNSATTFNQNLATWNISNVTDMTDMLSNSGLSLANYDATLIGWATQTVQAGVNLGATGLQYCAGAAARTTLTNTPNNWVITGDAQLCAGYFSRKTGNWSDVTAGDGTWSTVAVGGASCDCTPVAGADVVIDAAHIVTADVSTNTNSIALGGTLDLQDLTHTSTDINNNGGAGVLRIGGGTAAGTIAGTTGTFFTTATNTVEFYSTNIYDIPNRNYPSLAVSDASTKTLAVGGAVNIGGNLTVNTGAVLNAITNNVPITFPAGTHAILTDGAANLADVNVNGNTVLNNSGAYLNIAGNMAVALGVSFTNQSTNFGVNFNTLTSLLSGAGTYVNDTDAQMVYRSNVTPTIANFDATALNNGVLYDLGTAAPFNTTYYNLFFRDTRNTTAGTMTAYNFILDQVNPRLNLVDGTNIIVTNNLSLINTNPILDFGTGNATVTVAGNLVATAGTIIHSPAATFTQTLILNGVINDLGTFTVNPTAGTSVVRYAGVNQQVFASANYENIEIAGGGVKTLAGAVGASGTLTLTNGRLQLGANDLTLSNAIVANQLTGAPYTTSWVETDGAGSLIRQGADANVDFPVGDATAVRLATLSATAVGNNSARFTTVVAPPITGTNGSAGMWVMNRPAGASDITFSNVGGTSDATSEIHEGGWTLLPTTGGRPPYIAAGVAFTGANQNFTIFTAAAATYYSVGTGNWNNPASWSTVCGGAGGAGVPTAIDNVIICAGTNITLASPSACANLTVEATGALELANQDFTVNGITTIDGNLRDTQNGGTNTFTGNVTVNAGGALEALGTNSPFNFGANITNSGTFDLQNVTNNLNGINAIITANTNMKFNPDFVGTTNFNANCTLAGAGIITFSAATNTVAAGVTVTNNANADFFYVNPTAGSPTSTFINGANAFLTLRGIALPMTGGIFTANAVNNTVSYSRNAIQNILGGITYHHLEVYTNTKTIIGGNTIVNGNLTIRNTPNTILDANNFNINIRGNWITQAGSSFVGGTGTVTFDGNVAQSISGATNFNNLTVNQIPANLLTVNNPITVTGTLSLTNGRLQLGPNNLILNNPIVATQLVGAPYTTSWIETNAAGSLIRQGAVTGMDFPVGDATGVRLVSMSISGAGDNTVRFSPAIAPPIAGTNPAAGMWIINRTAGTTDLIFSNVGGTADATSQIHSGGWTVLATNVTLPNYTTTAGVAFTGVAQNFTIFTPSPVTPPTIQSFDIRFLSVTANTVGLQWTNGDGANRIVVASTSNVFTPPTNGVAYTIGQTLGAGTVVYNGNGNIATAYGLIPETKYFFHVFEYNGTGTTTAYNIFPATNNPNSITTLAIPPQNQPTNLIISDITAKSAKATFTLPIPVPAGHVAVIRKPDIDPLAPADGQTPTVGTLFFNGQTVVFSGNGNSFDLSNLEPFTTYIVEVYAYNGSGASITYKKDNPLSAEFTTSALLPTLTSLSVNEKEVGENAFTLQAIGSNFTSKTILRWQGKDLKTNFINKNNLSADVPRELLAEAGIFNIIAFTPPMGGGESNSLQFQVIAVTNISSVPVVSRTVPPDKNDHLLDRIAFEVVGGDVFLKEIRFTTNGSYQITDLKNMAFALKYSTDESLDNSDVTWATTTAVNSNGSIIFDFSQTLPTPQLPKNKTSFLFLTVNISKDAKAGNEIGTAPTNFDNIQFFGKVVKRGDNPTSAGTTQKIISVTPSPQDYSALLKFFNELGGTDWEESWNLDNPVNTWKGVELDEEGRVFAINLPNNNVVGELSDALTNEGVLVSTNLRYLNLSGNRIKGQIPPNLGNLTDLEYLDLSKNELSGSVPPSIGNLTKLVTLWLGYNNLTTIDIDFGRLTNLRNLFLQFNGFDKLPDNIGELKNLEVLSLKGNKFKTLPSTLGGLSKLKYLDISENELEQVPTGITNLTELEGLLMHINFFKTIPSDLLNLKKLNLFTTYENLLEFGSLEPLRTWWSNQSKMDITYFPQARIGRSQEVTVEVGSSFTFNLPVTGTANRYQWFKNGISISLSSNSSLTIPSVSVQDAGIYTLRVTNNLVPNLVLQSYEMLLSVDCGNARQTIKPKITIEGSSVFCNNEPVNTRLTTEIRPEISRYQWFLDGVLIANANSNSITVLDAGRYKVQIFTNDGCSLFSDAEVTITKLSAFTVNITQNQGVLVAGVANRVISNYEWFLNGNLIPNANQARYLPTERGNYTVRVTDVDGCRSTSAVEIVSSVTSTEESIYEGEIKVYPNPSDAIFYLEVGKEKALKIQLFNTLGQFFNQKIRHLQGNRYEINLGNQAWGMYFIEVTYQDGKVIKKLVKE